MSIHPVALRLRLANQMIVVDIYLPETVPGLLIRSQPRKVFHAKITYKIADCITLFSLSIYCSMSLAILAIVE